MNEGQLREYYRNLRFDVIANSKEKFTQIKLKNIDFQDSMRFNPTSMAKWIRVAEGCVPNIGGVFPAVDKIPPVDRVGDQ